MKYRVNDNRLDTPIQESGTASISVYDKDGNEYRISVSRFGDIEINGCDGGFLIETNTSNLIYLHTK